MTRTGPALALTLAATMLAAPASAGVHDPQYVILTTPELQTDAGWIHALKSQEGFDVEVVTLPDGVTSEEIQDELAELHAEFGFRYALLLGDQEALPMMQPDHAPFGWRPATNATETLTSDKDRGGLWTSAVNAGTAQRPDADLYNFFGMRADGWIRLPSQGCWQLKFRADDGGQVRLDNTATINVTKYNEPKTAWTCAWGSYLWKDIGLDYWENDGVAGMSLMWRSSMNQPFTEVPANNLYSLSSGFGTLDAAWYQFSKGDVPDNAADFATDIAAMSPVASSTIGSLEMGFVRDMPSDVYYADLDGDLDGEFTVGRLPASAAGEGVAMYLKGHGRHMLDGGSIDSFVFSEKDFKGWTPSLPNEVDGNEFVFDDRSSAGTKAELWMDGFGNRRDVDTDIVLYNGHGFDDGWSWAQEPPAAYGFMNGDNFALRARGWVDVPAGNYTLRVTSDDGAVLFVDSALAVDNWDGGSHGQQSATGTKYLSGWHFFDLRYQEVSGEAGFLVEMDDGDGFVPVAPEHFFIWDGGELWVHPGQTLQSSGTNPSYLPQTMPSLTMALPDGRFELTSKWKVTGADMAELRNDRAPVVLGLACATTWPEEPDNFGYQIMANPDGGAAVYVGSTRINISSTSQNLAKAIYARLDDAVDGGEEVGFGEVVQDAIFDLLVANGFDSRVSAYTYFGDPAFLVAERHPGVVAGEVALQADNGKYVRRASGNILRADTSGITAQARFDLVHLPDGHVALRGSNGLWVTAEDGGGQELRANRPYLQEWETFEPTWMSGGDVRLRADSNQFVCAEGGGGQNLVANRWGAAQWETFGLIDLGPAW